MSENGTSSSNGIKVPDLRGEILREITRYNEQVGRLVASSATLDAWGDAGMIPLNLTTALRVGRQYDTVNVRVDGTRVVVVMARDGHGSDVTEEIRTWDGVLRTYREVTARATHADLIHEKSMPERIAAIAWIRGDDERVIVQGPEGGRMARRAAIGALGRTGILAAIALASWRVLHRATTHMVPVAAVGIATAALATSAVVATRHAGDVDTPGTHVTYLQPGSARREPTTEGPRTSPRRAGMPAARPLIPGITSPSGPAPAAPPGTHQPPPLPILPAPSPPPGVIPTVPAPIPTMPVPPPAPTPPRRRRRPCALGLVLNPILGICVLPGT